MRHWILAVLFSAACGGSKSAPQVAVAPASEADAQQDPKTDSTDGLSADQAKAVLLAVDSACGDAWCEGDYNFRFKAIRCKFSAKTCTLTVQTGAYTDPSKMVWYWRSCKMNSVPSYSYMLDSHQAITSEFFDDVDACINKIADSLPNP
jgi:hypothetical protein